MSRRKTSFSASPDTQSLTERVPSAVLAEKPHFEESEEVVPSVAGSASYNDEAGYESPRSLDHSTSEIREIRKASSTLDRMESMPACALFAKVDQECEPLACDFPETQSFTSLDSGIIVARQILSDIFKKATKPKPVRRMKRPKIKNGWMHMNTAIPNFDINDEVFKNIMFSENLLVSCFEKGQNFPTPVGGLSLDIQPGRGGPLKYQKKKTRSDFWFPKFLVHLSSQLDFLGNNGGSRITAWVDRDLQTLEEKRREYLCLADEIDQQALYINAQENFYYLRHDKRKDIFYSPKKAGNLICEGSNFILMRYLAITKFVGSFQVTTLYMDGSLCKNVYECKGPHSAIVNDKKLDVCKIYRIITEECGIEHRSITLMTLDGQILKQEWTFCDHILQINPLTDVTHGKPTGHVRIPLESKAFTEDLQILSLYLDAKTRDKKLIENYMEDHSEIKEMLSDYVQTLLQLKPEDVFEFTAKYFLAFTPALLPLSEYFEGPYVDDEAEDYEFWKYI